MGCFDSSCAISKIPVHHGEKMIMLFIGTNDRTRREKFGGQWEPLSLAIRGEYNDYGWIENMEDDWGYKFFVDNVFPSFADVVKPTYRNREGGWDAFVDEARTGVQPLPDAWVWGDKCEWKEDEDKPGVFELTKGNGSSAEFIFIHEKIFNSIVEIGKQGNISYRDERPRTALIDEIDAFLERRRVLVCETPSDEDMEDLQDLKEKDAEKYKALLRAYARMALNSEMRGGPIDEILTLTNYSSGGLADKRVLDIIMEIVDGSLSDPTPEKTAYVKTMLTNVVEMMWFKTGLRSINHAIEPAQHTGSQYQESEEAADTMTFFDMCKTVQMDKLISSYGGDCLIAYHDYGSPEYVRMRPLVPKNDYDIKVIDPAIYLLFKCEDEAAQAIINAYCTKQHIEILGEVMSISTDETISKSEMANEAIKRIRKELSEQKESLQE